MIHIARVEEVGFCSFVFDRTGDLLAVKDPHTLKTLLTTHNEKEVVYLPSNTVIKGTIGKFTHSDLGALSSMQNMEVFDGRKISLAMFNAILTEFQRYRVAGISPANDKYDNGINITDNVLFDLGAALTGSHTFRGVCYVHPSEMHNIPGYELLRTISDKDNIYQSVCLANKIFYRTISTAKYTEDPISACLTPYTCLVANTDAVIPYNKEAKYGIPSQVEAVIIKVTEDFKVVVTDGSKLKTYTPYTSELGVHFTSGDDTKDLRGFIKSLYRK